MKELEQDGEVTKDEAKKGTERVQKQTDQFIAEIDKLLTAKEAEITEG